MLFATMLLMCQLTVTDGLLQDQGRTTQVAQAQSGRAGRGSPAPRSGRGRSAQQPASLEGVRVFRLKYAESFEVCQLLNNLLRGDYAHSNERTNSVICTGSGEQLEQIQKLLDTLDKPTDDARPAANLSIVPIRHRDARNLSIEIRSTLGSGSHLKVAADRARSAILLDGEKGALLKAKTIIRELDTPAATAQLEFSFFRARLHGDGAAPKIPEDLQPVAKELRRFGQVELLGRLSTMATEQQAFRIEGMIANMISAEVAGTLLGAGEDGSVKIELNTEMSLRDPVSESKQRKGARPPHFALRTVVHARRGEFIVLGSAPNGWKSGDSAILVLHVPH